MRDNILDSGPVQPMPAAAHPFNSGHLGESLDERGHQVRLEPAFQDSVPGEQRRGVRFLAAPDGPARSHQPLLRPGSQSGRERGARRPGPAFFAPTFAGSSDAADGLLDRRPALQRNPVLDRTGRQSGRPSISGSEPGEPGLAEWDWFVPNSAPEALVPAGCVATCTEDPITGVGQANPDQLVLNSKHVTLKNLNVENAVVGAPPCRRRCDDRRAPPAVTRGQDRRTPDSVGHTAPADPGFIRSSPAGRW